jgi:hypothetical protein
VFSRIRQTAKAETMTDRVFSASCIIVEVGYVDKMKHLRASHLVCSPKLRHPRIKFALKAGKALLEVVRPDFTTVVPLLLVASGIRCVDRNQGMRLYGQIERLCRRR